LVEIDVPVDEDKKPLVFWEGLMVYPHYDPFMFDEKSTLRDGNLADAIVCRVVRGSFNA